MPEGFLESELEVPWAEPNWAAQGRREKINRIFLMYMENCKSIGVVKVPLHFNI